MMQYLWLINLAFFETTSPVSAHTTYVISKLLNRIRNNYSQEEKLRMYYAYMTDVKPPTLS